MNTPQRRFRKTFTRIFLFFLALPCFLAAQQPGLTVEKIRQTELQLKQLSDSITKGSTDHVREVSLAAFNPIFFDLLSDDATYSYPFDSLKTVSRIESPDGKLRIFTWLIVSKKEGTSSHYGILQRKNPETGSISTIGLLDTNWTNAEAEQTAMKTSRWFGAIYYDIIERKIQKRTCYFVLGWKGNDRFSTKKVIDVIVFDEWDNVTLGMPVFTDEKTRKYRVVFEFNAQAVMLLRYEKRKKVIVFDHLSPSSPSLKGQYRHYGPDFTYDGYRFRKGLWIYRPNLELRNPGERK